MTTPPSLLVATTNLHKLREIRAMLGDRLSIELLSLWDHSGYEAPEETGETCEENAVLKAQTAAKELGGWVLADDSALVVPALEGRPGVRSARYAGEDASYFDNRRKLLKEMEPLDDLQRSGYLEAWMVLAGPDGVVKVVHGVCEGEILREEQGANGFGYDSIFRKYGYSKSMAQLTEDVKNRISHRFQALEKILPSLESIH